MSIKATLFYVHDPMCSWCWGFTRVLIELLEQVPADLKVQRVLGGLAPDTDSPMPPSMQEYVKNNWRRIEDTISGVKFNYDFWTKNIPRRSTYPACRAVIAARQQGEKYDVLMTKAIQKAYYQEACNPSDNLTLIHLANDLNLLVDDFKSDLISDAIQEKLMQEINLAREIYAESFPNLVLKIENKMHSIKLDYNNSKIMLNNINQILNVHEGY